MEVNRILMFYQRHIRHTEKQNSHSHPSCGDRDVSAEFKITRVFLISAYKGSDLIVAGQE